MNETEGIFSILNLLNLNLRKGQAARSAHFGSTAILAENCRIHQHALAQRICFFLQVPAKNLSDMNAQQGKYLRFSAGHAITPPGSVANFYRSKQLRNLHFYHAPAATICFLASTGHSIPSEFVSNSYLIPVPVSKLSAAPNPSCTLTSCLKRVKSCRYQLVRTWHSQISWVSCLSPKLQSAGPRVSPLTSQARGTSTCQPG